MTGADERARRSRHLTSGRLEKAGSPAATRTRAVAAGVTAMAALRLATERSRWTKADQPMSSHASARSAGRAMPASSVLYSRRALQLSAAAGGSLVDVAACLIRNQGPDRKKALHATLARSVARFGPASVKLAQLLATRRDILPAGLCDELAAFWGDRVEGISPLEHERARRLLLDMAPGLTFSEVELIGRGSIAYVFHATYPSGTERALKVLKPGVAEEIHADMAIARKLAALMQRLPPARGIPVKEMADHLCNAIEGQTDLSAEAESLGALREALASLPHVRVPKPYLEESTPAMLSMEWLPPPAASSTSDAAKAEEIMLLIYRMLFQDGLVHVDLHPGNLRVEGDTVVVYDAGFVMQIDRASQKSLALFFLGLAVGDGEACARAVIDACAAVPEKFVFDSFATAMQEIVEHHSGARSGQFNVVDLARELFDVQRSFHIYPSPLFIFPLMSLVAVEGQVRNLHPDLDFQELSIPYVSMAMES
jgi:ubiquinone biosynthesis protein